MDVANAHLRRAYEAEPNAASLLEVVDALTSNHEPRRTRDFIAKERTRAASIGGAALVEQLDARLASLPASQPCAGPGPREPSARMREGYDAQAGDRQAEALQAFRAAAVEPVDPFHTARAAMFLDAHGEPVAAATARSQVRVALHECGVDVSLVPVQTWYTSQAAWTGERLAMMKMLTPIGQVQNASALLQIWAVDGTARPLSETHLEHPSHVMAVAADGRTIVHDQGAWLVARDARTGMSGVRMEVGGERVHALEVSGAGERMMVIAASGRVTKLWDARGKLLGTYELQGTTPTITRAYTGQGAHHHNFLRDDPTWPSSVALSADQRTVAVGGSDSKVRLYDRVDGSKKLLEFKWKYTERRHMGGNPDLNTPVALRFAPKGNQLLAVYNHGDMILWDVRTGRMARHVEGLCTVEEATKAVNRFNDASTPVKAPSEQERIGCGRAEAARISDDMRFAASAPASLGGVRVREVSGSPIAMLLEESLPSQYLSLSSTGTLSMGDLYGAIALWKAPQTAVSHAVPPAQNGPLDPVLSRDGRILQFEFLLPRHEHLLWNLSSNAKLSSPATEREQILAMSPGGGYAAIGSDAGIEIRDVRTRSVRAKFPAAGATSQVAFGGDRSFLVARFTAAIGHAGSEFQVCDVASGACKKVELVADQGQWLLSEDGRWVAQYAHHGPLRMWEASNGGRRLKTDTATRHAAFSRDGSLIAWLDQTEHKPHFSAKAQNTGSGEVFEAKLDGWPAWVEPSANGTEVLILTENGWLWRWKPATGEMKSAYRVDLIGVRRVQIAENGKTVLLTKYDQVEICRNDEALTRVATVYPLLSGGWLVQNAAGEVDGSPDAVRSVVTRANTLVMDGAVGWEAMQSSGVLRRAME